MSRTGPASLSQPRKRVKRSGSKKPIWFTQLRKQKKGCLRGGGGGRGGRRCRSVVLGRGLFVVSLSVVVRVSGLSASGLSLSGAGCLSSVRRSSVCRLRASVCRPRARAVCCCLLSCPVGLRSVILGCGLLVVCCCSTCRLVRGLLSSRPSRSDASGAGCCLLSLSGRSSLGCWLFPSVCRLARAAP